MSPLKRTSVYASSMLTVSPLEAQVPATPTPIGTLTAISPYIDIYVNSASVNRYVVQVHTSDTISTISSVYLSTLYMEALSQSSIRTHCDIIARAASLGSKCNAIA